MKAHKNHLLHLAITASMVNSSPHRFITVPALSQGRVIYGNVGQSHRYCLKSVR